MKANDVLIILFIILIFAIPVGPRTAPETIDILASEGMVAFAVNNINFIEEEVEPREECKCNGTGKVKSGDGLADIVCQCGEGCICKKPDGPKPPVDNECKCGCTFKGCKCGMPQKAGVACASELNILPRQMLYFTAEWCLPCKQFEKEQIPELVARKWGVDTQKNSYIKKIDIDKYPELYAKYRGDDEFIPLFILLENGKEVDRLIGYRKAEELTQMWYRNFKNE